MLEIKEIADLISGEIPEAEIYARDLTGGGDHFEVFVVSDRFQGKSRVEQHQMVMQPLSELLKGPLHALALKTYTHEAWAKVQEQAQRKDI